MFFPLVLLLVTHGIMYQWTALISFVGYIPTISRELRFLFDINFETLCLNLAQNNILKSAIDYLELIIENSRSFPTEISLNSLPKTPA